ETQLKAPLHDLSALELLKYLTVFSDTEYRFEGGWVVLKKRGDVASEPVREYEWPRAYFGEGGVPEDLVAFFNSKAMPIPEWGFAKYDAQRQVLTVKATEEGLEEFDYWISFYKSATERAPRRR